MLKRIAIVCIVVSILGIVLFFNVAVWSGVFYPKFDWVGAYLATLTNLISIGGINVLYEASR